MIRNPMLWNSHETSDFLYTLGNDYWNSVFRLRDKQFTAQRIIFFDNRDAALFEQQVPQIEHRNAIVAAIEWICNPTHWSANSLSCWLNSLGSDFKSVAAHALSSKFSGAELLTLTIDEVTLLCGSEKRLLRVYLELKRIGFVPSWNPLKLAPDLIKTQKTALLRNENEKNRYLQPKVIDRKEKVVEKKVKTNELDRDMASLQSEISDCFSYEQLDKLISKWHFALRVKLSEEPSLRNLTASKIESPSVSSVGNSKTSFLPPALNGNPLYPSVSAPFLIPSGSIDNTFSFQINPPSFPSYFPSLLSVPSLVSPSFPPEIIIPSTMTSYERGPIKTGNEQCPKNELIEKVRFCASQQTSSEMSTEGHPFLLDDVFHSIEESGKEVSMLVVEERDFCFSSSCCRVLQDKQQSITIEGFRLFACSPLSEEECFEEGAKSHLDFLKCFSKNRVFFSQRLEEELSSVFEYFRFDHLVWWLPLSEPLDTIFLVAEKLLKKEQGKLWLTLCGDEAKRWKLGEAAEKHNYRLVSVGKIKAENLPSFERSSQSHDHDCFCDELAVNYLFMRN